MHETAQNGEQSNTTAAEQEADTASKPKYAFYDNFFVSGGVQTFFAVSKLKDYTLPKPGWRLSAGYSLFHTQKHSVPIFMETGHSVVSGTNQLIRTFDIYPVVVQAAYEYTPVPLFSVGAFGGFGVGISHIEHWQTVLDLITGKKKQSTGIDPLLSAGITTGINLFDGSVEFRASFGVDLLFEKELTVPLPSFCLAFRMYPSRAYRYAKSKGLPIVRIQEKQVIVAREVPAQKEAEKPNDFKSIYVYFEPEKAELDVNAVAKIKQAAAVLQANPDLYAFFEGSAAPFGTRESRIHTETLRVRSISAYLQKSCNIARDRIVYIEPVGGSGRQKNAPYKKEAYTKYRYVKIRFVRMQFNTNENNIYEGTE